MERRGADSAGNSKVFASFDELRRLFDRLPDRFAADDLSATGLTAGRRHMVLWHLVEHPGFDCGLVSRQPLTAEKTPDGERDADQKTATGVAEP